MKLLSIHDRLIAAVILLGLGIWPETRVVGLFLFVIFLTLIFYGSVMLLTERISLRAFGRTADDATSETIKGTARFVGFAASSLLLSMSFKADGLLRPYAEPYFFNVADYVHVYPIIAVVIVALGVTFTVYEISLKR